MSSGGQDSINAETQQEEFQGAELHFKESIVLRQSEVMAINYVEYIKGGK